MITFLVSMPFLIAFAVVVMILGTLKMNRWGELEPTKKMKEDWKKKGLI